MDTLTRAAILAEIDKGGWKNSWHLKKVDGSIDFFDQDNQMKIIEILIAERDEAISTAHRCSELVKKIEAFKESSQ